MGTEKKTGKFKRNTRELRKTLLVGILSVTLLLSGLSVLSPAFAEADSGKKTIKLVESVRIGKGDSLWSIASEYYTEECGGMKRYINEIKRTNHLSSDTIHEGNYLLVPYYGNESH